MAHLITLAHQAAEIHGRYMEIHNAVFGFSIRQIFSLRQATGDVDYCAHEETLDGLRAQLKGVQTVVVSLKNTDLVKTSVMEFRVVLKDYIVALLDTIDRLRFICARLCQEESEEAAHYSTPHLNLDKMAYDESIQHYKKLGRRLNRLLAAL